MRASSRGAFLLALAALLYGAERGGAAELRPTWAPHEGVELRLAASRGLAGAEIRVEPASGGRVRLAGRVRDESQRERALRIASQTPGVAGVDDRLALAPDLPEPAERPDADVARNVAQRLAAQSPASATAEKTWTRGWRVRGERWSLAVDVDDGDVLLEGDVLLQEHLRRFVLAARGVPGVRSVRADAQVRAEPPPDDPYHP